MRSLTASPVAFALLLLVAAQGCSGEQGSGGDGADAGGAETGGDGGGGLDDAAADTGGGATDGGGGGGGCASDNDCAPFDDGDACNGLLRCDVASHACKIDPATVVACDPKDDTACTRAACDAKTGVCAQKPALDGLVCEDGDPCTVGDRCVTGTCVKGGLDICACHTDADCPDEDADVCSGKPYCDKAAAPYVCKLLPSSIVSCKDDGDPCTNPACDPKTGACSVTPVADGGDCNDNNPCTKGDQCLAGTCSGGADTCKCKVDSDCEDDGNLCNGTPFCDKADAGGTCKPNPKSVVSCNDQADTSCLKNSCVPALGTCKLSAIEEGKGCDDANSCTTGEICIGGACTGGTDTCKCNADADCAGKEDGNQCNGKLFCNKQTGSCELNPATIVSCPTVGDTACAKNVCVPATGTCEVKPRELVKQLGCQAIDLGGGVVAQFCIFGTKAEGEAADPGPFSCEDGQACTKGDVCAGGACKSGAKVCNCASDADCASKDDGDLCNGTMYCDPTKDNGTCAINPATVVSCPSVDDSECLKNKCQPKSGTCQPTPSPSGTACSDGDSCSQGDLCKLGACVSGKAVCACKVDADCKASEDGDLCNGTLYCDKSGAAPVCKLDPKSVVTCPSVDDTACTKTLCQPKTGSCQPTAAAPGTLCDDGDACTKGDVCKLGVCAPGAYTCECKADADCLAKEDGNLCNGTLFCDKSGAAPACKQKPNSVISCPSVDDTACSKNKCNVKTGTCGFVDQPTGAPCDDGELCTASDSCHQGKCTPGTFTCACKTDSDCLSKEDGNFCNGTLFCDTTGATPVCKVKANSIVTCPNVDDTACVKNTCQPKTGGCLPAQVAPGTACDDGDACTKSDICKLGVCSAGAFACECKADADCLGKDDGNLCNGVLYCDKGGAAPACKPLPNSAIFCSKTDDTACLQAACDGKTGKCALQPVAAGTACDDGKVCTTAEVCSSGACGSGKPNPCDDANPCTIDSCDAALGCKHAAKGCDDGNACTSEGCDSKTGNCTAPVSVKAGALCNGDANGCTAGDACDGKGACQTGTPVICQAPQNPCQAALCVDKGGSDYGCATATRPDGSACDDGKSCLVGAACKAGACQPPGLETLYANVSASSLPAVGAQSATTALRGVAALPAGDIAVVGQRRDKASDAATTNKAFVSRYDVTMQAQRLRWSVAYGGPVAHASTAAAAVAAVGEELVVAADLPLAGGAISADLRRLDAKGQVVWTTPSANLAWGVAYNAQPGGAGRVLALAADPSGALALLLAPQVPKGAKIDGNTQANAHDVLRVIIAGVDGQKDAEWVRVPAEVWGVVTAERGDIRWAGTAGVDVTATLRWVAANKSVYQGATAARLSPTGTPVIGGAFEAIYGLHTDDLSTPDRWVGQVLARDGQGRTIRGRLHETTPNVVDGLFERTDAKGQQPLRYDTKLIGEPTRVLPLGKESLAFAGAQAADAGVVFGAVDSRGNIAWSRTLPGPTWSFAGLAVAEGDHLLVAVNQAVGGTSVGRVLRVDAFGHESCAAAGVCDVKASDACDDADACTRDSCDPKAGCTHTATDALACDATNGCSARAVCGGGACKQSDEGRVFTTIGGIGISRLPQPYVDDKLGVCWLTYQTAGNSMPPTRHCLPWDKGEVALDINTAPGAACDGMATLIQSVQEGVEAVVPAAGGLPGCVRWGDAYVSGTSGRRATFTLVSPGWTFNYNNCSTTGCDEQALAAHRTPSGAYWAVHYETPKATGALRVRRLVKHAITGQPVSTATTTLTRASYGHFRAAAERPDDGLLVATFVNVASYDQARLVAFATDAATTYSASAAVAGHNVLPYAVAPLADGGAVVVGEATPPGAVKGSWRWRVNKSGQTLWSKVPASPEGRALVAIRPLASSLVAVGGETKDAATSGLLLAMRYDNGATLWEEGLGPGLSGVSADWARLVDLPDGGFAVLWRLFDGQYNRVAVTRTDAWGHATCNAAGGCSAKSLVDCDDGVACNVDTCDELTGKCGHANFAGTAPCGTSGVCSASAVCIE